jgi:ketosteroid isomerase-like protein
VTEQQIKDAMRGFINAWTTGDIKKALALFTDDTVWVTPQGTFKGIAESEKYANWVYKGSKDFKIMENGIGVIVQGDTAVIEHDVSGNMDGMKWVSPAACIWEFKDGKVARVRTFYDVLSQAQQVAKGPAKIAVNAVVKAANKGL